MRRTLAVVPAALFAVVSGVLVLASSGIFSGSAQAAQLHANPWVFVGNAGDCGTGYPAGSNIVTAGWLSGLGLPDNGGSNANSTNPMDNPNKTDVHRGLLLSKNGPTPDCSSAGATITGAKNMMVPAAGLNLGFDIRNGTHCGAGAPRFNVTYKPATGPQASSFIGGCANSTLTPATQDPAEWTTAIANTSNAAQAFPPIPAGSKIVSIDIVYDEGTDTPTAQDPNGVGLATIDNIVVGDQVIRTGNGTAEPHGSRGDRHDKNRGDDENDRD